MADEVESHWHLDKRLPLGLFIGLIMQTIVLVYVGTAWKVDIDHRLAILERIAASLAPHENRIIILEQKFDFISSTLSRIESKIERPVSEREGMK